METTVAKDNQQKHFVLVHGGCHGAWCWYKLKPLLETAGHRVTAIDLSASGINTKSLDEIHTLDDYAEPLLKLMASIPADKKVILVGHSYGGCSVGLAMEKYPHKVSVAVFVAALMPDVVYSMEYIFEQYQRRAPDNLDTQYFMSGGSEKPILTILLGPKDLATNFYQLCSTQDLELAKFLVRPTSLLKEDFPNRKFSVEGYGSIKRVYIVCPEDKAVHTDFQQWLVENIVVEEVKVIEGADHMAMLSKPKELCQSLLEIADKYI